MKNIIFLSVVASSLFGVDVVNNLNINAKNSSNNSNFSGSATVSQGQTDIQNNSTVTDLSIVQKNGTDAGNLIDNVTITGTNQLHQGLTSINNSRVEHTDLNSKNEVKNVNITGSTSVVTQGTLLIGGNSNVTGTAGSGGHHGGSGNHIKITEINSLKDTNIENSTIDQGLTTINNEATVSQTFKLNQKNSLTRVDSFGYDVGHSNNANSSAITQGLTTISGGDISSVEQDIDNSMSDIIIDGTTIHQSSINFTNSTVSHINDGNQITNQDEINIIEHLTGIGTSNITQSSISGTNSQITNLQRYDRGNKAQNNWMDTVIVNNSDIQQSTFEAKGSTGSTVTNVTYTLNGNYDRDAVNDIYNITATNHSNIKQDSTIVDNGNLENSTISRVDFITQLTSNSSDISQNILEVKNSTANHLQLTKDNSIGEWDGTGVNITNAILAQGSTIITD